MNNGKTLVAAAVAAILAAPASHAAIDDAGMQYTSAAEGFYGSLRMAFTTSATKTAATKDRLSGVDASASRLGVRGTVDLGGGMSAGYNYEFGVRGDNGAEIGTTRLHNVGLSGGFGSFLVGTQWALDYNYVWGNTDVMNVNSGRFAYNINRAGRQSKAITYTSPDFNGFSFGISGIMNSSSEVASVSSRASELVANPDPSLSSLFDVVDVNLQIAEGAEADDLDRVENNVAGLTVSADGDEAATIDKTVLAAGYSNRGFNIAGTYVRRDVPRVVVDATIGAADDGSEDVTAAKIASANPSSIGLRLGYGQDNWSLNYVYGKTDYDSAVDVEEEHHSLAGQLQVGKTTLRALYETQETSVAILDAEIDYYTLSAQYDLGSRSRVWAEYTGEDNELSGVDSTAFNVGYRVDF